MIGSDLELDLNLNLNGHTIVSSGIRGKDSSICVGTEDNLVIVKIFNAPDSKDIVLDFTGGTTAIHVKLGSK